MGSSGDLTAESLSFVEVPFEAVEIGDHKKNCEGDEKPCHKPIEEVAPPGLLLFVPVFC